jgi:UDP-2,4-diacetamido-2,4,6-trideoxy-beta-L-altropyranose hydrolase
MVARKHEVAILAGGTGRAARGDLAHSDWLGVDQDVDAADTLRAVGGTCDWIVVDHYALDARWESALRRVAGRIMVIDDLADRVHDCDVLLDQNLLRGMNERYVGKVAAECDLLLGPRYALLQRGYPKLRRTVVARRQPVRNILVYFGGADTEAITDAALEACLQLGMMRLRVDVVVSASSAGAPALEQKASARANVRIHRGVPTLAPLMAQADLAIGGCGATSWERLCLGLPSIVVTLAENQREVASRLHELKLAQWLGHHDAVGVPQFTEALRSAVDCPSISEWSHRCLEVCDGTGAELVLTAMIARTAGSPVEAPPVADPGRDKHVN